MAFEPPDLRAAATDPPFHGNRQIPLVEDTTVAFVGRTERGPLNEPVAIDDFDGYRRVFGGHCSFSFVSIAVQHFFLHGGGAAVVVRVANRAQRGLIEVPAGEDVLRLQARQPGSHEFLRVSIDYDRVAGEAGRFNLVVQRLSRPGSQLVEDQELFEGISIDENDERFVVDALRSSELVRVSGPPPAWRPNATRAAYPGQPIPYLDMCSSGSDGDELTDYDIIGSNKEGTGLFALDRCDRVDLLCVPPPPGRDLGDTTFLAAERYCARRRAMLVWDPPWSVSTTDAAMLWVRSTSQVSKNALTYFPRVRPRGNPARYPTGLPACGAVAGILANNDRLGVWNTMPLDTSLLRANLTPTVDATPRQSAMLRRFGVNVFERAQGGSSALHGNVSFAGPNIVTSLWQCLDRRRLRAFVLNSIERHMKLVLSASVESSAAAELETEVWFFLARLRQRGALPGGKPEQAFFIRAQTGARGAGGPPFTLRVGFALQRAGEFLVYDVCYGRGRVATRPVSVPDAEQYAG